jgi:predicted dehydrogenase
MKKKVVKIGIVGCGRVFNHYMKIFNKRKKKDFKIIAICDKNRNLFSKVSKILKC